MSARKGSVNEQDLPAWDEMQADAADKLIPQRCETCGRFLRKEVQTFGGKPIGHIMKCVKIVSDGDGYAHL